MNEFELNPLFFDNKIEIDKRLAQCEKEKAGKLKSVLSYLYLQDGPGNLHKFARLKPVEVYLSKAEIKAARWLSTLTTRSRKIYGKNALIAFRAAKGKCNKCGFADVRCLEIDHTNSVRNCDSPQECICANCHKIETYQRQKNDS